MPDLLTHYAVSYLISSRAAKAKQAAILALIGLLPDIDVLFRIHRWATHSLLLTAIISSIAITIALKREFKYTSLIALLYGLHIAMDVFVAPTPLLWPLTSQAYMIDIQISGTITEGGIGIFANITATTEPINFTQQPYIEGPIISTTGIITATAVAAILAIEHLTHRLKAINSKKHY
ncbi:MAG: metal-dependent hydrolase [Candidatus Nezhaarchaeales archaeon]